MKTRILFLHSGSDLYGSGRILLNTVSILIHEGYSCDVFLPQPGPLVEEIQKRGVGVRFMDLGILRRKYTTPFGIVGRLCRLLWGVVRISAFVKKNGVALIYSNTMAVFAGAIASRVTHTKHLWHVHEMIVAPVWLARITAWSIQRLTDSTVTVSGAVRRHYEGLFTMQPSRVKVIYNGIDINAFGVDYPDNVRSQIGFNDNQVVLGMVGRVHYWKGQDYFLRIASEIVSRHKNVRFVMAGDVFPGYEQLYDDLEVLKRQLGITQLVVDLGYRTDVPRVMNMIDIFILPSTQPDPLPTVVLEAMAASRVVVATNHGGAPEMVADRETGFLIPWDDAKLAADVIEPLIGNPELRLQMGRKGRERLNQLFSIATYREKILCEVKDLVKSEQ